ncbi:hypothetical protein LCGC14_0974320 [marine sediment metagenome]|uniref:Uncharacterized protein n=1 Tax=marine sediment metagenome TaxID=412755 RepID=A0A0F9NWV1_9ZZZZ
MGPTPIADGGQAGGIRYVRAGPMPRRNSWCCNGLRHCRQSGRITRAAYTPAGPPIRVILEPAILPTFISTFTPTDVVQAHRPWLRQTGVKRRLNRVWRGVVRVHNRRKHDSGLPL